MNQAEGSQSAEEQLHYPLLSNINCVKRLWTIHISQNISRKLRSCHTWVALRKSKHKSFGGSNRIHQWLEVVKYKHNWRKQQLETINVPLVFMQKYLMNVANDILLMLLGSCQLKAHFLCLSQKICRLNPTWKSAGRKKPDSRTSCSFLLRLSETFTDVGNQALSVLECAN